MTCKKIKDDILMSPFKLGIYKFYYSLKYPSWLINLKPTVKIEEKKDCKK